jgi:FkbM family methyltransferase
LREELWWKLHNSQFVQKLYSRPVLAPIMRKASYFLVPSSRVKRMKVKSGPGKGIVLDLCPRWEPKLWLGDYELSSQEVVGRYFKLGKTFYDVGGGVGFYSLVAARMGAEVFTIEPDPKSLEWIARNARINNLDGNIHLMPLAANSYTGTMLMEPSPSDTERGHGHGHAQEVFGTDPSKCFEAKCTTLDDFAREHPHPDLIKIDVEGCEAAVVRGAEWLMREVRPSILCEIHTPELAAEVSEIVRCRNYKIEWLDNAGYAVQFLYATAA